MSDPGRNTEPSVGQGKLDPDALVLRGWPRRVARFNRRVVIGGAAGACVLVAVATMVALYAPPLNRGSAGTELLSTNPKQVADGLANLPSSYGELAPKPVPPKLGPPLPGDLGPAVTRVEQNLGIPPQQAQEFGLRPNPEEDAAQAERIRLARQAQAALESKVFFAVSTRQEQTADAASGASASNNRLGAPENSTVVGSAPTGRLDLDPNRDPNNQQHKLDFLNAKQDDSAIYNPHALQQPISPYEVMAGTVISASLTTGLNSDLPGFVIAQVTDNVYDTITGEILLIPQGSRLIGTYDSVVAFGQSRALVVWQRIVMPTGYSIVIDNLPATDSSGYAGLEDDVDYHTWRLLKGIALSTLLGVGSQVTFGTQRSNLVEAIRESTQQGVNQAGQTIVEKDLNVQPSITVRPGWPLQVIVHKDLVLRPYQG
jgi:type IV secretion system protein VirB10